MLSKFESQCSALEEILRSMPNPPRVVRDEPMREHTTFHIGGPADLFFEPRDARQVAAAVRACRELSLPLLVLGNGSNLIVRDGGLRGAAMHIGADMARWVIQDTRLTAQAGLPLKAAARAAAGAGLAGLVFAEGIPGSVGGGACMNAGAYGGEMAQVVEAVEIVDLAGEIRTLPKERLDYTYRHSAMLKQGWIVTQVTYALAHGDPEALNAEMRELAARRREKQPLRYPSAGSTFKRPPGHFAAKLIEEAGLKGLRMGGAEVSTQHAGFVVNTGGATAADVLSLIAQVRERVLAHSGVALEPEVRIVGEEA